MCFSATASFAASAVIGAIGIATLRHVREPRALLFAAVPLLFSLHQFTEGFVWLGLTGKIGPIARDHVIFLFMLYAQGVLPLLMPLAVLLMEPPGWRRIVIMGLSAVGVVVSAAMIYGLIFLPSQCFIQQNSIAYRNPVGSDFTMSSLYIFAICGALIFSTHRVVRWFGLLNIIGLSIVELVKEYAFASVWCFYAALLSIVIFWQFRGRSINVKMPNGISPILRPLLLPWLRLTRNAPE